MPIRIPLLLLTTLLSLEAGADIYTWKDDRGQTHFGDRPPSGTATKTLDPQVNTVSRPALQARETRQVVIYSAEWCGVCRKAKSYFRDQGIAYREYDIDKSRKGRLDYQRMHGTGVPIILVGGQRLDGFTPARFEALYHPR